MFGLKTENQRHNPFSFFYSQLSGHEDIIAVDDVYVNMLHVQDLVGCIKYAVDHSTTGTYNISGDEVVNRYEFVWTIKAQLPESRSVITRVSSDNFVTVAARPRNTSFDNQKMKRVFDCKPQSLESIVSKLISQSRCRDTIAA